MPTATLNFNLPEDEFDFKCAVKGAAAVSVIDETLNQLRQWIKYGHEFKTPDEALEAVREFMRDELSDAADRVESV